MQRSSHIPRFPEAGWLGAKIRPLFGRRTRRVQAAAGKQRASPEDLERLRQKFAKDAKN